MSETMAEMSRVVQETFLIPQNFEEMARPLADVAIGLPKELGAIASAFTDNLHGVQRTLSIPFKYAYSEIHSFYRHRIRLAAMIRSGARVEDEASMSEAEATARINFEKFLEGDGRVQIPEEVLKKLLSQLEDADSLAAAKQLTRQGVVLTWSSLEVLARDAFVWLLNTNPAIATRLLVDAPKTKGRRYFSERIDWPTLAGYGYDLSKKLGTYLVAQADLKNVSTIREAYGTMFPSAAGLQTQLGDERLWKLSQKRNLIVHKGGIADQIYLDATGDCVEIGTPIWVTPNEIESLMEAAIAVGAEILREVAAAA